MLQFWDGCCIFSLILGCQVFFWLWQVFEGYWGLTVCWCFFFWLVSFLLAVNKFVIGLVDESFDGSDGFECYSFEIVAAFLAWYLVSRFLTLTGFWRLLIWSLLFEICFGYGSDLGLTVLWRFEVWQFVDGFLRLDSLLMVFEACVNCFWYLA